MSRRTKAFFTHVYLLCVSMAVYISYFFHNHKSESCFLSN